MKSIANKHYETFTATERLNLTISAMAREDSAEFDRLWKTTPVKFYHAQDLGYAQRFQSMVLIMMRFTELCQFYYTKIVLNEALALVHSIVSDIPKHPLAEFSTSAEDAHDAKAKNIALLKSVYQGLNEFCHEVGLNSQDLIKSVLIERKCPGIEAYLAEPIEPDHQKIKTSKKELSTLWK